MIDSHCHLEQKDYENDLDAVLEKCKNAGLKAIITSCANPKDFQKSLGIIGKYKDYIFLTAAIHPEYIKEITQAKIQNYFEALKNNRSKLVGIGETGLDFAWVKEEEWRNKQKELFRNFIRLSKELDLPLVVHSRDAYEETINILEEEDAKRVLLHLWGGNEFVKKIIEKEWYVSFGPLIATSKKHAKIARDMPLDKILLETDSPWFGGKDENGKPQRGDPTNIRIAAEKIARVKKLPFEEIWKKCGENALRFYSL